MMESELTRGRKTTTDSGLFASSLDANVTVCPDPKDCPIPDAPVSSSLDANVTVCPDPKDCPIPDASVDTGA